MSIPLTDISLLVSWWHLSGNPLLRWGATGPSPPHKLSAVIFPRKGGWLSICSLHNPVLQRGYNYFCLYVVIWPWVSLIFSSPVDYLSLPQTVWRACYRASTIAFTLWISYIKNIIFYTIAVTCFLALPISCSVRYIDLETVYCVSF